MGLSTSQRFLLEADRAAGHSDVFHWRRVGETLGYSETQSGQALDSLGQRRLVLVLSDGQVRLSPAGRQLAVKLATKIAVDDEAPVRGRRR
jgi:hypothetical protein